MTVYFFFYVACESLAVLWLTQSRPCLGGRSYLTWTSATTILGERRGEVARSEDVSQGLWMGQSQDWTACFQSLVCSGPTLAWSVRGATDLDQEPENVNKHTGHRKAFLVPLLPEACACEHGPQSSLYITCRYRDTQYCDYVIKRRGWGVARAKRRRCIFLNYEVLLYAGFKS